MTPATRNSSVANRAPRILERDFQEQVIHFAQLNGWRVAHFRPARTEKGWRTPVQANGQGFPDLVLTRRDRLVFAELKSDTGTVTREQAAWLDALAATGAETHVWSPDDWPAVAATLARTLIEVLDTDPDTPA